MLRALSILAALAVLADGASTYVAIYDGRKDANPVRRFLVARLGLWGGTVGLSTVAAVALVLSADYSERIAGFHATAVPLLAIALVCGWAAKTNWSR